jgi:NACHT domain
MSDSDDGHNKAVARNSGITSTGEVHQEAGQDAIGRDQTKMDLRGLFNVVIGSAQRPETLSSIQRENLDGLRASAAYNFRSRTREDTVSVALHFEQAMSALPRHFTPYHLGERNPVGATDATLTTIFAESRVRGGGHLLVLGEPGSGKSTCLLGLASDLALSQESKVPVYIPISRWRSSDAKYRLSERIVNRSANEAFRHPMARWLAEQVEQFHHRDAMIVREWIGDGRLILLLDGLDEISSSDARESFVRSINTFFRLCPCPIMLTCRLAEYEALSARVEFSDAVVIRSLADADVLKALSDAGGRLAGVRAMVQSDPRLLELCRTPLLLQVIAYAYADVAPDQMESKGELSELRSRMFEDYIDRQLAPPSDTHVVGRRRRKMLTPEANRRALTALARRLKRRSYTEFHLQDMRIDWLVPGFISIFLARCGIVCLIGMSIRLRWSLLLISAYAAAVAWDSSTFRAWRFSNITVRAVLTWSGAGLIVGGSVAFVNRSFFSSIRFGPVYSLPWWVNVLLLGLVDGCLMGIFASGVGIVRPASMSSPYAALRKLALNGAVTLLACGGLTLAASLLTINGAGTTNSVPPVFYGAYHTSDYPLFFAAWAALAFGLFFGLGTVLDHLIVRLVMLASPSTPKYYVRWLEDMVRRRLMYRAGDGYVFLHQMLLDQLADASPAVGAQRSRYGSPTGALNGQ